LNNQSTYKQKPTKLDPPFSIQMGWSQEPRVDRYKLKGSRIASSNSPTLEKLVQKKRSE
jgi:hypothetical protein